MEVCQNEFFKKLPRILTNISNSTFVTLDLEMSGITARSRFSPNNRSCDIKKLTLQQQYEEVRTAADTYQILQMGITVVEEERDKDLYIARPYNFDLSPLSYGGVEIGLQRNFSFSSSACDFLQKNGFDFGKVFHTGVTYLSRAEEAYIRLEDTGRAERNSKIPDLIIKSDDKKAIEFCNYVKTSITDWLKKPTYNYVNIAGNDNKLTGFQRRLVYQTVRNEFPHLRTFGRSDGDFMQIEKLDSKKEAIYQTTRLQKFNAKIGKQIGLRWIFEALCGGNVSGIHPDWIHNSEDNEAKKEPQDIAREISELDAKLREKNHVIVGHNLFMDLAFLYKTFVGPLPTNVEEFQDEIHILFPRIIDTKFMATCGLETKFIRSSLRELLKSFKRHTDPLILLHQEHRGYGNSYNKDHEAGYDSWMTAELFVKISAKLNLERMKPEGFSATEAGSQSMDTTNRIKYGDDCSAENEFNNDSTGTSTPIQEAISQPKYVKLNVASMNPYELLENVDSKQDTVDDSTAGANADVAQQLLPDFKSSFWQTYFNKLRLNSIEGDICNLVRCNVGRSNVDAQPVNGQSPKR